MIARGVAWQLAGWRLAGQRLPFLPSLSARQIFEPRVAEPLTVKRKARVPRRGYRANFTTASCSTYSCLFSSRRCLNLPRMSCQYGRQPAWDGDTAPPPLQARWDRRGSSSSSFSTRESRTARSHLPQANSSRGKLGEIPLYEQFR